MFESILVVCIVVVSLECVNVCNKLWKGDGSGRYDCSILSCAWKAPRVLTGFLASTAHPPQCSSSHNARTGRKTRINFVSSLAGFLFNEFLMHMLLWISLLFLTFSIFQLQQFYFC